MTRLADALDRANRAPDPEPQPAAPAAAAPPAPAHSRAHAHTHGHGQPHARRLQPAAIVAARHGAAPPVAHVTSTPLLAMPEPGNQNTAWRTDPQLVGKLLGTDGFSG